MKSLFQVQRLHKHFHQTTPKHFAWSFQFVSIDIDLPVYQGEPRALDTIPQEKIWQCQIKQSAGATPYPEKKVHTQLTRYYYALSRARDKRITQHSPQSIVLSHNRRSFSIISVSSVRAAAKQAVDVCCFKKRSLSSSDVVALRRTVVDCFPIIYADDIATGISYII